MTTRCFSRRFRFPIPDSRFPIPGFLAFCFFLQHLHGDRHESIELVVRRARQQRLGPEMILAGRVAVEQPAEERHERDPLELRATSRVLAVVVRAEQGLEPVRIAECLCRQRGNHLTEANVALGEGLGVALGPEEDRADDG